jgi:thioredoxin 1
MHTASKTGSFDELITSSATPVLVDFTADWCGPCRMLAPTLDQLAKDYSGRLKIVKVDVDRRPSIAARYHIQGVPTLILFASGEAVWRRSGVLPYPTLATEIDRYIT